MTRTTLIPALLALAIAAGACTGGYDRSTMEGAAGANGLGIAATDGVGSSMPPRQPASDTAPPINFLDPALYVGGAGA